MLEGVAAGEGLASTGVLFYSDERGGNWIER